MLAPKIRDTRKANGLITHTNYFGSIVKDWNISRAQKPSNQGTVLEPSHRCSPTASIMIAQAGEHRRRARQSPKNASILGFVKRSGIGDKVARQADYVRLGL
jgi:hypothetical protein